MRSTGSLMIAAVLALIVSDARAQESSISLNVDGSSQQIQRTPALVIHEVYSLPAAVKNAPAAALKSPSSQAKNPASKSSQVGAPATGTPSVVPSTAPI